MAFCGAGDHFGCPEDLPADHPRGKRACLPDGIDTPSHVDQPLNTGDVQLGDTEVTLSKLYGETVNPFLRYTRINGLDAPRSRPA